MAIEKVIDVKIQSEQAEGAVKSLRTQFREAQQDVAQLSEKFGATSKEAVEAAKRAGELKDRIGDAKALTDAFNPDAKFKSLTASLSGVAGGFAAVQGAIGLMGVESESVEKTLLKVQSAMALSTGLQQLGESADAFKQLKAVAINALNGIKAAIGSTGIGLLVVALGAVYAYWDDIKEVIGGVSEEQKQLNKLSQSNLDAEKGKLDAIGSQDNILKLQGKSEKDILKMKIAQTDQTIKAGEINLQNQIVTNKLALDAEKRNYKLLRSVLDFLTIPISTIYQMGAKAINGVIELVNKIPGVNIEARLDEKLIEKGKDSLAKLIFDPKETEEEGKKVVAEQKKYLKKLENDKAGLQLQVKAIDQKASDDAQAKAEEKSKKAEEANQKELDELQKQKDALKSIEEKHAKDIEDLNAKTEREKLELQAERDMAELDQIKLSEEEKQKARQEIIDKYKILGKELDQKEAEEKTTKDLEDKQKEFEDQTLTFEERRQLLDEQSKMIDEGFFKSEEERTKSKDENAKARIELDKLETESKQAQLEGIGNALMAMSAIAGESTSAGKALAVASTAISTYSTAQKAYESAFLPVPTISSPALGAVFASVAVAGGLMNIKKILSVKTPSGKGSAVSAPSISASGGGGGATSAPQFNMIGNSGTNQLATSLGNAMQSNPVQAYVVASDVTTAQSLNRNIVQNATLG
jgi:hypothetical protein